jgi:membrane associated rhomboid family serine protease
MIPLFVDVPMKRVPWANWVLIAVTIVVSLAVPYKTDTFEVRDLVPEISGEFRVRVVTHTDYSPLVLQPDHFEPHQLVTALFQHAGLLHLFGNMLFLFVFGNPINAKLGHLPFLLAYFGIGALESLVWLIAGPDVPCLGASAAIMGVCGMFLILYPRNEVAVWDEWLAWMQGDWAPSLAGWVVVLGYVAFDVWGSLFQRHSGVAYSAHVVGFLLGVGLAVGLLRARWLRTAIGEQTLLDWYAGRGPREKKRRGYRRFPKPHPDQGIKPTDDVPRL